MSTTRSINPSPTKTHPDVTSKRNLALHVRQWHGTQRQATPYRLLLNWTMDELRNVHTDYHARAETPEQVTS